MPNLTFNRIFSKKYNTSTITIVGASSKLEDCETLNIDEIEYGYRKAVVKLSPEKVIKMKEF